MVPVTYLRWDLVSGSAGDEWGSHNVDAPHVRIVSMNAVDSAEGAVVMGEVVNEDTIPAFVNVNATLVDASGSAIDDESSFDKILHVLLPKQVSPYRIDFPEYQPEQGEKCAHGREGHTGSGLIRPRDRRDESESWRRMLRADSSAGRVVEPERGDGQHSACHRQFLRQQRQGRVGFGRIRRASSCCRNRASPFAVEIPKSLAGKVQNFHVVVNQYSLQEHSVRRGSAFLLGVLCLAATVFAQDVTLHPPSGAIAGEADSIDAGGSGSATFYLVGPQAR